MNTSVLVYVVFCARNCHIACKVSKYNNSRARESESVESGAAVVFVFNIHCWRVYFVVLPLCCSVVFVQNKPADAAAIANDKPIVGLSLGRSVGWSASQPARSLKC